MMYIYHIYVYIYDIYIMEYCSALKKNEILPLATMCMGLEGILLSGISQIEKKYSMLSLICGT